MVSPLHYCLRLCSHLPAAYRHRHSANYDWVLVRICDEGRFEMVGRDLWCIGSSRHGLCAPEDGQSSCAKLLKVADLAAEALG